MNLPDAGVAPRPSKNSSWVGLGIVSLLFMASLALRIGDFKNVNGVPNLEATYHVLLTIKALRETPVSHSHFLPIVTLGSDRDKYVSWGATVPTETGEFVYTSFPPLGFLVPYSFFAIFDWAPTTRHLMVFNALLGGVSTLGLFALLMRVLRSAGYGHGVRSVGAIAGAACLVFSKEALVSFGLVYWSQSLEEAFLLFQLIALHALWTRPGRSAVIAMAVMSFLSASTEWSGMVANVCIAALLIGRGPCDSRIENLKLGLVVFASTLLAGGVIAAQFISVLGLRQTAVAMGHRMIARSAMHTDALALLDGYANSFGLFLPLVLGCAMWMAVAARGTEPARASRIPAVLVLAASFPLIENALLLQHATEFTFDRLKLATPLALVLALSLASAVVARDRLVIALLCLGILVSARENVTTYQNQKAAFADWGVSVRSNESLRDRVAGVIDLTCADLGSNGPVRAYTNLLFNRAVLENASPEALEAHAHRTAACGTVFLSQTTLHIDLPEFRRATIRTADGKELVVVP